MTRSSIWFGPGDRPLFGMLHLPEHGTARAGVVLCSPLGREDLWAHSAYRLLAERLEEEGIAVLRFDYDGTGDSAGEQHDGSRVAAWSASTAQAMELMRSTGAPVVAAVGMRMGALLAALDAVRRPLDALVLWDPCWSGRSFLREQRALQALSVGGPEPTDGSVQTPGFRYDAETVADLQRLDLAGTEGPLAARLFVVTRPDRPPDARAGERLAGAGKLDTGSALGQQALLSVDGRFGSDAQRTIESIVAWLVGVAAEEPVRLEVAPLLAREEGAVVGAAAEQRRIVERPVRIGSAGLFGILTELEDAARAPVAVCFNTGKSRHVGPSRLWVDLARMWAARGIRTLRVDLSGLGDSDTHPGQRRDVYYPGEALRDIEEVAGFLAGCEASGLVFVGLCSGAYHAVLGALALGATGVCACNPVFTGRPIAHDLRPPGGAEAGPEPGAAPGPAPVAPSGMGTALRRRIAGLARRDAARAVLRALPDGAWWALDRLGLWSAPATYLETLVRAGSSVLVVVGAEEAVHLRRGGARRMRRLAAGGGLRFDVIEDLDHAMFGPHDRDRVLEIVYAHVVEQFAA